MRKRLDLVQEIVRTVTITQDRSVRDSVFNSIQPAWMSSALDLIQLASQ